MSYQESGYDKILAGLRRTRAWLDEVGIGTTGTRVEEIERVLVEFTRNIQEKPRREVEDRWDWENDPSAYYALSDGDGFNRMHRNLSSYPSHRLPRGLLKRAVAGPLCPIEEEPTSTDGRNIFLELDLGTKLLESGIEVTGWDDVQFTFDKAQYTVQCKRPFSGRGVPRNVQSARDQIHDRSLKSPHLRGLIAIGVDKVYGLDRKRPEPVENTERLNRKVLDLTDRFHGAFSYSWEQGKADHLAGVLLVFRFLCHFLPTNTITTVGIEVLTPSIRSRLKDHKQLLALTSVLAKTGRLEQ